jgi:hypothetical protein
MDWCCVNSSILATVSKTGVLAIHDMRRCGLGQTAAASSNFGGVSIATAGGGGPPLRQVSWSHLDQNSLVASGDREVSVWDSRMVGAAALTVFSPVSSRDAGETLQSVVWCMEDQQRVLAVSTSAGSIQWWHAGAREGGGRPEHGDNSSSGAAVGGAFRSAAVKSSSSSSSLAGAVSPAGPTSGVPSGSCYSFTQLLAGPIAGKGWV